jgi:TetR/AcrR family transcriptional regulator, cholesterol catabolism regulator
MEEKKQQILSNVCNLYLKYGIRNITMDDIAVEFGISKKTLYQYFNDKEDLVAQVFDFYMHNPVFTFNNSDQGNSIDRIFAVRNHVSVVIKNFNNKFEFELKKLYPALFKKWHDFKVKQIYENTFQNIESGKTEGLFRNELDTDLLARLQVGRMLLTLNTESGIFSETEVSSIEVFDKIMDYHLHAICTPRGLEYYKEKMKTQDMYTIRHIS